MCTNSRAHRRPRSKANAREIVNNNSSSTCCCLHHHDLLPLLGLLLPHNHPHLPRLLPHNLPSFSTQRHSHSVGLGTVFSATGTNEDRRHVPQGMSQIIPSMSEGHLSSSSSSSLTFPVSKEVGTSSCMSTRCFFRPSCHPFFKIPSFQPSSPVRILNVADDCSLEGSLNGRSCRHKIGLNNKDNNTELKTAR